MAQIGSLSVKLGLVTVEWDKATDKAKAQAKQLQKSFEDLTGGVKQLNEYWKMLGGTISVGSIGFAALMQQTIQFTDEISDLAKGFGITVSQTLAFRDALTGAGVSADNAARMMSTLFSKIDEARDGNDKTIGQFEKLGITLGELKTSSPYEVIKKVADGFANVGDQIEKVRLIKDFFGKAGIGVDIEEVSRVLDSGTERFDKYAEAIQKMGVISDNIKKSMENLKIAFAGLVAPFTQDKIVSIEKFQAILLSIAAASTVAIVGKLAIQIYEVAAAIRAAAAAGAVFNATAGSFSPTGILLKGAGLIAGAAAYLYSTNQSSQASTIPSDIPVGGFPPAGEPPLGGPPSDEMSKEAQAKQAQVSLTNQLILLEQRRYALQLKQVGSSDERIKLAIEDVTLQEKIAQIESKRTQDLAQFKDGSEAVKQQINALADAEIKRAKNATQSNKDIINANIKKIQSEYELKRIEEYRQGMILFTQENQRKQLAANKDILDMQLKEIEYQSQLNNLAIEGNTSLGDFAKKLAIEENKTAEAIAKLRKELESLPEYIDLPAEMLSEETRANNQRITNLKNQIEFEKQRHDLTISNLKNERTFQAGMDQAFANFLENSKDMSKVAIEAIDSVTSNINSAISNLVKNGKLSFKSFAKSVLQDLLVIAMRMQAMNLLTGILPKSLFVPSNANTIIPMQPGGGYADGGEPPMGKISLVGERGPELFVPKTAGTIIPHSKLSGMMGNTTNITNNYIDAIDVQSFEQRLLGSSNAVWAANQYANKSLAVGRGRA